MAALVHYEADLEGSFWRYGTDLADLYRDEMTLRQLLVRVRALPPDSPLKLRVAEDQDRAEAKRQVQEIDDVLAPFRRPGPREG